MAYEGDMYVFNSHIPVEVNSAPIVNPSGADAVEGCVPHRREPSLLVLWVPPVQMVQLAPGMRWCACCGDVRHKSYFDVVAELDDGTPVYDPWCKQCRNEHDPRLRPTKYCSRCKQEKRRAEFSPREPSVDGLRSWCKECEAEVKRDEYREVVGRPVRKYERQAVAV